MTKIIDIIETNTFKELKERKINWEEWIIFYDDENIYSPDDELIEWLIINPENPERYTYRYILKSSILGEEIEKATTKKYWKYCSWNSNLYSETKDKIYKVFYDDELYENEKENEYIEIIKNANKKLEDIKYAYSYEWSETYNIDYYFKLSDFL